MSMSTKIQNTDDVVLDQTSQEKIGHENIELDNETNELLSIGLQKNDSDDGKVSEDTGEDTTEEDLEVIDSVNDIKIPKRFDGESEVAYNMRVQIALATEAKRRATTEEEKSVASERLKQLRRGLGEEIKKTPTQEQTITTSALRDAPNSKVFLNRVKNDLGLSIKVIDGEKESYFGGVATSNLLHDDEFITLDIVTGKQIGRAHV